jgi:hypothetical protein
VEYGRLLRWAISSWLFAVARAASLWSSGQGNGRCVNDHRAMNRTPGRPVRFGTPIDAYQSLAWLMHGTMPGAASLLLPLSVQSGFLHVDTQHFKAAVVITA